MNKREAVARVPLFAKLDPKHLDKLADMSVPRSFPKDTLLIKEGTVGLGMFIIVSGRVEVYKGEGESRTTLSVLEASSIVGEMALIDDQYRSANVRALEPSECLLVSRDSFNTLIRQDPDVGLAIMAALAERIRTSHAKIQELQHKVNETVAEVRQKSDDWTAEDTPAPRRGESYRHEEPTRARGEPARMGDPISQMVDAQRIMIRAGTEWLSSWMSMVGAFLGGATRMVDSAKGAARDGLREVTTSLPRRSFQSVTSAIDEGLRSYEDVRAGGGPQTSRSYEDRGARCEDDVRTGGAARR